MMVELLAGWLLPDAVLEALNDDELALLIQACHFHDLGMAGTEADNRTAQGREQVRREHAVSIGDRIMQRWRDLGFRNETSAEVLALVCKGHRPLRVDGTATWSNLPEIRILGPDRSVRVRLISAIVYAADELHIGEDRAPRREEEFNEIRSVESRRHWRRHQAVMGPTQSNGFLGFEGTVVSPGFECDLRIALKKAFNAVQELNSELAHAGIHSKVSQIRFTWNRKKTWELLVARQCSDLETHTKCELVEAVRDHFTTAIGHASDISSCCLEVPKLEDIDAEILEVVQDFIVRSYLIEEDGSCRLSIDNRSARALFDAAREADSAEVILVDQVPTQYENFLLKSALGAVYLREYVIPEIQANLNVRNLASADGQLTAILEASPTAARMLHMITPPPSVMVQNDLMLFASIAGSCADLVGDPEAILNEEYRGALTKLFELGGQRLPEFLNFIQELALIRGHTPSQVAEAAFILSNESDDAEPSENEGSASFGLTQSYPTTRPKWNIGYLILAASRSGTRVALSSSSLTQLTLRENSVEAKDNVREIAEVSVGPSTPVPPERITLRAKPELDPEKSRLTIVCSKLSSVEAEACWMSCVIKPPRQLSGETQPVDCTFSIIESEVAVGSLTEVSVVDKELRAGRWDIGLDLLGNEQKLLESVIVGKLLEGLDMKLARRLASSDPDLPYPVYLDLAMREDLLECSEDEFPARLKAALDECAANDLELVTFFIKYTNSKGEDYFEESCGTQHPSFRLSAPRLNGDRAAQETLETAWSEGRACRLESSFREDTETLAGELRMWLSEPSNPFPFQVGNNDLMFHYARTRLIITFGEVTDKRWYRHRQVVFQFRQLSRHEQYIIEREYWAAQKDDERAQLLTDLIKGSGPSSGAER